jgi:hypothetical protein
MPGWQLLAGTQRIGNSFTHSLKGVNDNLNANYFYDGNRGYTQSQMGKPGTFDGKTVYLNLMSAADYLDYVFRRQFPNVQGARRTMLKTIDRFSEAERQELENPRMQLHYATLQLLQQTPGSQNMHLRQTTADRSLAEYKWVQDGDTIVHTMEVVLTAQYSEYRALYHNSSEITWNQNWLSTVTCPAKNKKKAEADIAQMKASAKFNNEYAATLNAIMQQDIRNMQAEVYRQDMEVRRIQAEMAQAQIRHQQRQAQILNETAEHANNVFREVHANRQATMSRVNQGWRDVLVGVDRYMGTDGKVMEVPTSMGSKV